jgi:hypothetical protein
VGLAAKVLRKTWFQNGIEKYLKRCRFISEISQGLSVLIGLLRLIGLPQLEFIARIVALASPPRQLRHRNYGVLVPNARHHLRRTRLLLRRQASRSTASASRSSARIGGNRQGTLRASVRCKNSCRERPTAGVGKKISDDVLKALASKEFRENLATKGISTLALASGPLQSYYLADL